MDFSIFAKLGIHPDTVQVEYANTACMEKGVEYQIKLKAPDKPQCPYCHSLNVVGNGTYKRSLRATFNRNFIEIFTFEIHRFRCRNKNCPHSSFSQPVPGAVGKKTIAKSVKQAIIADFTQLKTFADIAREYNLSRSEILRIFDAAHKNVPRGKLGKVLCVDEIRLGKLGGDGYPFVMVDGITDELLDVVESRQRDKLARYFNTFPQAELNRVEYFCSDMHVPYRSIRKMFFPKAKHCIDLFHVVSLLSRAVAQERVNTVGRTPRDGWLYRFSKKHWRWFQSRAENIPDKLYDRSRSAEESDLMPITYKDAVNEVLSRYPNLQACYDALQALYRLVDGKTQKPAKETIIWIANKLIGSNSVFGRTAGKTLLDWRLEIVNTFETREAGLNISNAHAEGNNGRIRKLFNQSNGTVDFKRTRNRLLVIFGQRRKEPQRVIKKVLKESE